MSLQLAYARGGILRAHPDKLACYLMRAPANLSRLRFDRDSGQLLYQTKAGHELDDDALSDPLELVEPVEDERCSSIARMRRVRFWLLAIGLAAPAAAQMEHVGKYEARVFEDETTDARMLYRLFRPEGYDPSQRYPLVVYLHGGGGLGTDNLKQLMGGNVWATRLFASPEVQQKHPSFVLVPQVNPSAPAEGWGGFVGRSSAGTKPVSAPAGEPIDLLIGLIDSLGAELSLDAQRVYVTGQSMGGYGTWAAIARYPGTFAAAAPICGGGDPSAAARIGIPVWAFHGADDKTIPAERSRSMIEALKAAGAEPRYTEYPGVGHHSYEKAFSDPKLVEWLFSQRRR